MSVRFWNHCPPLCFVQALAIFHFHSTWFRSKPLLSTLIKRTPRSPQVFHTRCVSRGRTPSSRHTVCLKDAVAWLAILCERMRLVSGPLIPPGRQSSRIEGHTRCMPNHILYSPNFNSHLTRVRVLASRSISPMLALVLFPSLSGCILDTSDLDYLGGVYLCGVCGSWEKTDDRRKKRIVSRERDYTLAEDSGSRKCRSADK